MKLIEKPKGFLKDVKVEMAKVSWPSREELKGSTLVVIVVTLMFAGFTFIADRSLSELMKLLYSYAAGN